MISLKGRRILITGGGKRLGRVLRVRLAESGVDVIVHSHSGSAEGIVGDLSTEAGCVKLISDADAQRIFNGADTTQSRGTGKGTAGKDL